MLKYRTDRVISYRFRDGRLKSDPRRDSKPEPKIFTPRHRPLSGGGGRTAKIQSAGDGHYLYLQTQFGEDQCTQFRVIVVTGPQTHIQTNKQTHRQDRLQYTVNAITKRDFTRCTLAAH